MDFREWLIKEKKYSERSSKDVLSRLRRVNTLANEDVIDNTTLDKLINLEEFKVLSVSIRSQLKRAIRLNMEYVDAFK